MENSLFPGMTMKAVRAAAAGQPAEGREGCSPFSTGFPKQTSCYEEEMRELAPGPGGIAAARPALPKLFPFCYPWGTAPGFCRPPVLRQAPGVITQPRAGQSGELIPLLMNGMTRLSGERLQPRRELAKTSTPRPRSPVGMELGYPCQNEGGNSFPSPLVRKGRAKTLAWNASASQSSDLFIAASFECGESVRQKGYFSHLRSSAGNRRWIHTRPVSLGPYDFTPTPYTRPESVQHPNQANRETALGDQPEARPGLSPRTDFSPAQPNKDIFSVLPQNKTDGNPSPGCQVVG